MDMYTYRDATEIKLVQKETKYGENMKQISTDSGTLDIAGGQNNKFTGKSRVRGSLLLPLPAMVGRRRSRFGALRIDGSAARGACREGGLAAGCQGNGRGCTKRRGRRG